MTAGESPGSSKDSNSVDTQVRNELLKTAIVALPMLLVGMTLDWLKVRIMSQPGQALWIIIPAIVFVSLILFRTATRQSFKLGWPFVGFFAIYILIFFTAAETSLLDWRRSLVGYNKSVPPNFIALNHFGDWHYRFGRKGDEEWDFAIVLMKFRRTPQEKSNPHQDRLMIADMIRLAQLYQAKGIALDFYLSDYSSYFPDDGSPDNRVDEFLCDAIESAKEHMPVFVGYDYRSENGIDKQEIDPDLEKCLSESAQGHIIGYAEGDGIIRSVPLYFRHSRALESLSLRVAKSFDPQVKEPDNGLLQFTRPENDFPVTTFDTLMNNPDKRSILRSRFIFVGEESEEVTTPYGRKPGVEIHAYAAYSLKHNQFIQRGSWWSSLLMIFLLCYLIMVLTSRGAGNLKLVLINGAFSLLIVVIAVLAMHVSLTWIDVVYPLVATWGFLVLLIAIRTIAARRAK